MKREQTAYKAAGLTEDARDVSIRIRRLNKEYAEFSKAAGLPEQRDRMTAQYVDDASEKGAQVLKELRDAEAPIREAIRNGSYPLKINTEKQMRHMLGTATPGRSIITISVEELQNIINLNAGNGKINLTDDLKGWKNTEIIDASKEIGYTINREGKQIFTKSLKIHYSKTGTHAVPYSRRWRK